MFFNTWVISLKIATLTMLIHCHQKINYIHWGVPQIIVESYYIMKKHDLLYTVNREIFAGVLILRSLRSRRSRRNFPRKIYFVSE
jgi:ribosomal protein S26